MEGRKGTVGKREEGLSRFIPEIGNCFHIPSGALEDHPGITNVQKITQRK